MTERGVEAMVPTAPPGRSSRLHRSWVIALLVSAALVTAGQLGSTAWKQAGIVDRAKPFISAYVVQPLGMPASVRRGSVIPMTFALSSHDGATGVLRWQVSMSRQAPVQSGTVDLTSDTTRTVRLPLHFNARPGPSSIVVTFEGHPDLTLRLLTKVGA